MVLARLMRRACSLLVHHAGCYGETMKWPASQLTQLHPQLLTRSASQRRIFQEISAVVAITADLCLLHKHQVKSSQVANF